MSLIIMICFQAAKSPPKAEDFSEKKDHQLNTETPSQSTKYQPSSAGNLSAWRSWISKFPSSARGKLALIKFPSGSNKMK